MTQSLTLPAAQTSRVSLIAAMASRYGMDPSAFAATIKATVMPTGATNEQMAAFLLVAHEYELNPITREIYAFPAKGGGVTPVVGVDGWINLAQRRSEFDGLEHEWAHDDKGAPISCTCRVWRKDRTRPVVVTEFMDECKRATDPWRSHPRRMLRHKATIQAIRYAFGFAGIKDEDDAEVIYADAAVVEQPKPTVTDLNARLSAAVGQPDAPAWPQPHPETGELIDARGIPWIEAAHSIGRTCTADGRWRPKRGIDPTLVEQAEAAAMGAPTDQGSTEPPPADPQTDAPTDGAPEPGPAAEVLAGIGRAKSGDDVDGWLDEARLLDLADDERGQIETAASARRAELSAA